MSDWTNKCSFFNRLVKTYLASKSIWASIAIVNIASIAYNPPIGEYPTDSTASVLFPCNNIENFIICIWNNRKLKHTANSSFDKNIISTEFEGGGGGNLEGVKFWTIFGLESPPKLKLLVRPWFCLLLQLEMLDNYHQA